MTTAPVSRGERPPLLLPVELKDFSTLSVSDLLGRKVSFSEYLEKTFTDAFLVLHRGKIVYEWGRTRDLHPIWSISKGFVGVLAEVASEEGKLDRARKASTYVPELVHDDQNFYVLTCVKAPAIE